MTDAELPIEVDPVELADFAEPVKLALEIHRQLRKQFGEVPRRVPLTGIAKAIGIFGPKEFETDRFEGTLVVQDGYGAMGLRKGLRSGRRNFTMGHEIGHFVIPHHRLLRSRFACAKADLNRPSENYSARPPQERIEMEANEFSATLLVPTEEFSRERRRLGAGADVSHIRRLAEMFDVSQEMMAGLYVRNSEEKIAIITSYNGKVRRIIPGTGFPYLGLRRDVPIPEQSFTRKFGAASNQNEISELQEIGTHIWLDRSRSVGALYEQVFAQEEGWAMTLLSVEEVEFDEDEVDRNWNRRSGRLPESEY